LHFQVHRFDGFATLGAAANVGLIGDDNQEEVRSLKPRTPVWNIVIKLERSDMRWGMRHPVPYRDAIEYTIAIQKNCRSR
jgi:hypothetical protein